MWSKRDNLSPMKDTLKLYTAYSVKLSTEGLFTVHCVNFYIWLASLHISYWLLIHLPIIKDSSYIKGRVVCDLEEGETVNDKLKE
jgi:hypothetical protein